MTTVLSFDAYGDAQHTRGHEFAGLTIMYTDMEMRRVTEIHMDSNSRRFFIEWKIRIAQDGTEYVQRGDYHGMSHHIGVFGAEDTCPDSGALLTPKPCVAVKIELMNEKQTGRRYWLMMIAYGISELCYKYERWRGTAPDPVTLRRNIMGTYMSEWMAVFVRQMPDTYQFMDDRPIVFKAFMYGCNPTRVAEALLAKKRVIPYCLRWRDGIAF